MTSEKDNNTNTLAFSDVDIYYNYVFDIGQSVNPIDAARLLLDTDIAQAFRNQITGKSELAAIYKPMMNNYSRLRDIKKELDKGVDVARFTRMFRRNPVFMTKILFSVLRGQNKEPREENLPNRNEKNGLEELEETIRNITGSLLYLLAIHEYADSQIFSQGYLGGIPFVRVGLLPFSGVIDGEEIAFDMHLTIHRTGIAILTAYGVFNRELSVDQLKKLRYLSKIQVLNPELPTVAVERYEKLMADELPEIEEIKKGFTVTEDRFFAKYNGAVTGLEIILDLYSFFITETIFRKQFPSRGKLAAAKRSNIWYGYPIIFIKNITPKYENVQSFRESHETTLAGLVIGTNSESTLRLDYAKSICDADFSTHDDHSVYITEGSATVLYYERYKQKIPVSILGNEWIRRKFLTTVVIDVLLLQRSILAGFTSLLENVSEDLEELNELRREYLVALDEFEAIGLSHYGEVHDIIKKGQDIFRVNDLRKAFLLKSDNIEELVKAVESERRFSREKIAKILTTLIAALLSLNAAQSFVDVVIGWSSTLRGNYPDWTHFLYASVVELFKSRPTFATIFLYLLTILITIVTLWYGSIERWGRKRRVFVDNSKARIKEQTVPPIEFRLTAVDEDEETQASASEKAELAIPSSKSAPKVRSRRRRRGNGEGR
jgi:hypothetical protein